MRGVARPAVFLDRDGTINVKAAEDDYVKSPAELRLLDGAAHAIRRFNDVDALVIVVTNQRGIALGRLTEEGLAAVHAALRAQLRSSADARIDAFLHCPHDYCQCDCRKPGTGLLREACRLFPQLERGCSVLIGDAVTDIQAGERFGIDTLQLGVDAPDLAAATEVVLDRWQRSSCWPVQTG